MEERADGRTGAEAKSSEKAGKGIGAEKLRLVILDEPAVRTDEGVEVDELEQRDGQWTIRAMWW